MDSEWEKVQYPEGLQAIGYIRVSTISQENNTSLDGQEAAIRAFCEKTGLKVSKVYSDIQSGTDPERPGLKKALRAVKKFSASLVVLRVDRLSRSVKHMLDILDRLKSLHAPLRVVELDTDSMTHSGRMILTITTAVAEFEHSLILERTQAGRALKSVSGGYSYGAPSYGKISIDHELITVDSEVRVIGLIKTLRNKNYTYRDIATALNNRNIKPKRGDKWHASSVHKIYKRGTSDDKPSGRPAKHK